MRDDSTRLGSGSSEDATGNGSADAGNRIGPFRLVHRIGRGGMGDVWEAEQEHPVARRVALKLIKPGFDTQSVVARFESERRTLALMDHPGIAHVYDAGATPQGRPYFAMEFVDGEPIDRHADAHHLGVEERLRLFLAVCDAVQHAHQKGVIHRDIKPSNVLIHEIDGHPAPKVIDFGVAKATTARDRGETHETEIGVPVGTPAYMSPEQAEGRDVDTRTDVWSLGALLYTLLAGVPPFDVEGCTIDELRRRVRESDPPPPSASALAAGRGVPWSRRLRGDLDWITLRALEKERERRYSTASEMAADIRRHLADQPVVAGPPSRIYRLRKFVRRHRTGVTAGLLIALTLVSGATASTIGFVRALRAESIALQQAARANEEAEAARRIAVFLEGLFATSDPGQRRGTSITVQELLERGASRIRVGLEDQPLVRARLMDTMGRVYRNLGQSEAAERLVREAADLRERHHADPRERAASLDSVGQLLVERGDLATALPLARRALELRKDVLPADHPEIGRSLHNLAVVLGDLGEVAEARELFDRAIALRTRTLGATDPEVAASFFGLASLLARTEPGESRRLFEQALEIQERDLGSHADVARTHLALANVLRDSGSAALAREHYLRALEIQNASLGPGHPWSASTLCGLAELDAAEADFDAARAGLERALVIREASLGPDDPGFADTLWQLADVELRAGRAGRAESLRRRAIEIRRARFGAEEASVVYDEACDLALRGRSAEAIARLRDAARSGFDVDWIRRDPELERLRALPAYHVLLEELGSR